MSQFSDETIRIFLDESREHLADIETDLLAVEQGGANIDVELVNKVFRAAHSLKGGAAFFGFANMKELAHKIENVLDLVRSKQLVPNPEIINILLLSFDKLREMVNNVDASHGMDITEFVVSLAGLASSTLPKSRKDSIVKTRDVKLPGGRTVMQALEFDLDHASQGGKFVYLIEYDLIHDAQRIGKTPYDIVKDLLEGGQVLECVIDVAGVGTLDDDGPINKVPFFVLYATIAEPEMMAALLELGPERIHLQPQKKAAAAAPPPPSAPPAPAPPHAPEAAGDMAGASEQQEDEHAAEAAKGHAAPQADTSLRVSVHLLESLMNLAGELVLSRNQLLQAIGQNDQRTILSCGQRINLVTSELQEAIMLTRMQPIANIFNKFQRVVRDLARSLGKDVRLGMEGKEVELDKTIIEGLNDPLTHLVRNSVDHGIEAPEDRTASGKPKTGTIELKAYHEAGQVVIEVKDDGKGVDPDVISRAAVAKGLMTAEQVKLMSNRERTALIMLPGFSTAEKVTDVSGRGVGMDVVKTNIDKLGGQVDIESMPGAGTTIRIKLPLTLAIIPCLFVSVEGSRYAVPQVSVAELIRVPAAKVKERVERVGDAEVLILRGKMVPILDLSDVLGLESTYVDPDDGTRRADRRAIANRRSRVSPFFGQAGQDTASPEADERRTGSDRRERTASDLNIVVVTTGAFEYGMVVDELHDSIEIVVKPLGRKLKHLHEYAGATIMGNGRVALILDVDGIASNAGLTSLAGTTRAMELAAVAQQDKFQDVQHFLLFRNSAEEQCAVPLDLVQRVEQIRGAEVETAAGRRVIKYRGRTMPVFTLKDAANVQPLPMQEELLVIVFEMSGREIGLLALPPVDAVEAQVTVDNVTLRQTGIMGSAIIHDQTTLMVDIHDLVEHLHPEWFTERRRPEPAAAGAVSILLAEDSDFFRALVQKFIEGEGYRVVAAEDGQRAWELLQEQGDKVRLVVTDIEMPRMDGYGLTRAIKADKRFSHLPVIAVTSLAADEDIARGKAAGVDEYQIKLDKQKLLEAVSAYLQRNAAASV